ncbi:GntR family transcriptional regulator [Streptomyces panaciradicis]|uniref:GntR family transcriptional regulator n=1 Tax=Streptomyces panaciradicis TaxID=1470261 RepID=UPI00201D14FB|nr:GntR family transcriptional regulator [Streptomyces panaciradicis]MCL6674366.1 GntR family transcriptional regulator [Streptomyces panaciradicis]
MKAGESGAVLKRERVRDHILQLIDALHPGDSIPSERSLCAELDVSRPTLRVAVDELVAAGLLVRKHGRGMFVAPEKVTQELVSDSDGMTLPQASGIWSSRLLEFTTIAAGARVGRKLSLSPAANVVYAARLRLVDGSPMAIEHLHIRADLVPNLTTQELEAGDLYEHLRERHGVRVSDAVQTIEPTVVSQAEAQLLEVPHLSPALLFERLTNDDTGRPVEYVHSIYRGDRYRIVSRLTLNASPTGGRAPARVLLPGMEPGNVTQWEAASTDG